MIGWEPPEPGWCCANTDGSVILPIQSSTAGGIIRDEAGRFREAFSMNLGGGSITHAELMGVLQGLKCAWNLGIRKLELRTDSRTALALVTTAAPRHPHYRSVIQICRMLERDWEVRLKHTFREGNVVANFLAATEHHRPLGTHLIGSPCPELCHWLMYDLVGSQTPRLVPVS
ncbi:unnamed protein product [Linum tenue]|uniref:RNase H type-1 domain-containing protein n=1 Tax=Linum tenue TaxID=586396 RepID=A0AAV0GWG3_9ROSI|nr:unnamed protein product [Linum tenue]